MGEKRSSHAITEEYAKADPVYVAKTAVSPPAEVHCLRRANRTAGVAPDVLSLSTSAGRWKLWMAGYKYKDPSHMECTR